MLSANENSSGWVVWKPNFKDCFAQCKNIRELNKLYSQEKISKQQSVQHQNLLKILKQFTSPVPDYGLW